MKKKIFLYATNFIVYYKSINRNRGLSATNRPPSGQRHYGGRDIPVACKFPTQFLSKPKNRCRVFSKPKNRFLAACKPIFSVLYFDIQIANYATILTKTAIQCSFSFIYTTGGPALQGPDSTGSSAAQSKSA